MKRTILLLLLAFAFATSAFAGDGGRQVVQPYGDDGAAYVYQPALIFGSDGNVIMSNKFDKGFHNIATIGTAAAWLLTQQDSSGGFPWSVGDPNIYSNVQGPAGRGMLAGYNATGTATYLTSALSCGNYLVPNYPRTYTDGDPRFATHDPLFLEELTIVSGNTAYANFVQTYFWDKLTTSTYGESNNLDANGFGMAVVNGRNGQGIVELAPWDISAAAIAAHVAGETTNRDGIMAAILSGLDSTDASDNTYDVIGLAGACWASGVTGYALDPTLGRWAAANSTQDLIDSLLTYQNAQGGWVWSTTADINDLSNGDVQTTAFAVMALKAFNNTTYATEIANGLAFMFSQQQPSGQIFAYPGATSTTAGGVEVHAEAMQAIGSKNDSLIPVELTSFTVSATGQGVLLSWATATETENLGFYVYRSQAADGEYTQITAQMIPGQGSTAEAHSYEYIDTNVQPGNTYFYRLADVDYNGNMTFHGSVSVAVDALPADYALEQNFPNPFNPSTVIRFQLPSASGVSLAIYNTAGQLVRTLAGGELAAGSHSVMWDGTDDFGARVASGVYLYTLKAGSFSSHKKLVLTK